uniref:Uncharacterized protein n=1 Tax=Parascaris univalens TaxID=6257 RepID=A0A915A2S7_PARUN
MRYLCLVRKRFRSTKVCYRLPCCPTQHSTTWKDAVSCSEGLKLQQTQTTNGYCKDESDESTLVGIPAEMPFFQNEDDSNSEFPLLEETQESKEQVGNDSCSPHHFSSGDTLEGIPRVMPDFQDD